MSHSPDRPGHSDFTLDIFSDAALQDAFGCAALERTLCMLPALTDARQAFADTAAQPAAHNRCMAVPALRGIESALRYRLIQHAEPPLRPSRALQVGAFTAATIMTRMADAFIVYTIESFAEGVQLHASQLDASQLDDPADREAVAARAAALRQEPNAYLLATSMFDNLQAGVQTKPRAEIARLGGAFLARLTDEQGLGVAQHCLPGNDLIRIIASSTPPDWGSFDYFEHNVSRLAVRVMTAAADEQKRVVAQKLPAAAQYTIGVRHTLAYVSTGIDELAAAKAQEP